jgi:hypothetical protein
VCQSQLSSNVPGELFASVHAFCIVQRHHICSKDVPKLCAAAAAAAAEKGSSILVDEVVPGGHAAQAGVQAGDELLATTARPQVSWGDIHACVSAPGRNTSCGMCVL